METELGHLLQQSFEYNNNFIEVPLFCHSHVPDDPGVIVSLAQPGKEIKQTLSHTHWTYIDVHLAQTLPHTH